MDIKTSLALLIIIGHFACVGILAFCQIPAENQETVKLLMHTTRDCMLLVVGYFYGSSFGSDKKTNSMLQAQADAVDLQRNKQ